MKYYRNILLLICIFFTMFYGNISFCQKDKNIIYNLTLGYGYVANTNDFMNGVNVDNTKITSIKNFNFEVIKVVDGSKAWHHLYKDLHYGVGLFHGWFNYSKNIGNPSGLYGIIGFTPYQTKKFMIKTDIGLGISGIWKTFSSENPYNVAVSTPIDCYIHGKLSFCYNIDNNWQINMAGNFVHFSNGTILRPNKGINIITPLIGISYAPSQIKKIISKDKLAKNKYTENSVYIYGAIKGLYVTYIQDINYITNDTIQDTIRKQYGIFGLQYRSIYVNSLKHKLGWGGDITFNNTIDRTKGSNYKYKPKKEPNFFDQLTISLFFAYEYRINQFSFIVEPIGYIYKMQETYFPRFAQRIGFKYQFDNGIFAQLGLRAYQFTKADYIEWGIGYRFKRNI